MKIKTGLLLPHSVIYPTIAFDIANGLRCGYTGTQEIVATTENIGVASNDQDIYKVCEKMLMSGVNIIVGYINPTTAESLQPLFAAANAILIALDAGYHYPSKTDKLPNVFTISLQGALCCSVLAKHATESEKKTFAFATSYYDAGYRSALAIANSIEAGNAQLVYNHVTPLKRAEFSLDPLAQHLQLNTTDAVIASYCGDMAFDFYKELSQKNILNGAAIYVSPFMGEEEWLAQTPYPGSGIKTCVSWGRTLDNTQNKEFTANYMEQYGREANIFSLLGWEAGNIITKAETANSTAEAVNVLEGYSFDSPRGHVKIDTGTHTLFAPVYNAEIIENEATGKCALAPGGISGYTEEERTRTTDFINSFDGKYTSWYNAYACLDS